ncbi:nitrilase [Gemmatimonadetes bacterium T265]|nr:nitrilase [Gemmatimonadetes bacterium T265]
MTAPLRVALVQLAVADGEPADNLARAAALIRGAPAADLYLLPELFTTGYAHDAWAQAARESTPGVAATLQQLADARGAWIGGSMIAEVAGGGLANRFHLFAPAGAAGAAPVTYDKAHLFPPMGEPGRLTPGGARVRSCVGRGVAADVALSICFDLRFPEQYRLDAVAGATLFACVAEWPHPRGDTLRLLARARAAENQAWLALCNRVGPARDGTVFCGGSCVIAPDGAVVADAGDGVDTVTVAEVDVGAAHRARAGFAVLGLRVPGVDAE